MIYSKFTGPSYETLEAINAAKSHQLEAESVRLGLIPEPVDPDAAPRAEIADLGRMGATGAVVADALWQVSGYPVVPIDRDLLVPSADPLTAFSRSPITGGTTAPTVSGSPQGPTRRVGLSSRCAARQPP